MKSRFAFIIILVMAIGHSIPAISGDTLSEIETPLFSEPIPLPGQFDRVHLVPGKDRALIISRETGRCVLIDFARNVSEPIQEFEFRHRVDSIVVSEDGRFAYIAGVDVNIFAPLVWRIDIDIDMKNGSRRSIPLPFGIKEPQLALGVENHLVIADRVTNILAVLDTRKFDDKDPAARFPGKWFELEDITSEIAGTSAIAGHPEEDLVILFRGAESAVRGFSIKEMVLPYILTSIPLSDETYRPPALALAKGGDRKGRSSEPMVVIGDPAGSRIMIFDYNLSFQALDFVTEAPITDSGPRSRADQRETALVIAASDGFSAILVAPRRGKRVYFFSRKGNVLKRLNRWEQNEIVDLDVSANGHLALILADGGTSLVRVERPDALAASLLTGPSREVLQTQLRLSELGFMVGAADGILGPSTKRAIRLFQRSQELKETGELDKPTISRLYQEKKQIDYPERPAFENRFNNADISGFEAKEFLIFGQEEECKNKNRFPPKRTWCNAIRVAKVMAEFRKRWGQPVDIKAAYRSPEYSECIGGNKISPYTEFRAIDFSSPRGKPADWASVLKKMHRKGFFDGKIKARDEHVHLELGQTDELWVLVGNRSGKGDFESPYFDISKPPKPDQRLNSTIGVTLRASAPYKEDDRWVLSERVSALHPAVVFLVERAAEREYPGGEIQYWAGGHVLFKKTGIESEENENWYVVVKFDRSRERIESEISRLMETHPDLSFEVVRRMDLYVIVSGRNLEQAEAKKRVLDLRCAGVSDDPFIWLSKDWYQVKKR